MTHWLIRGLLALGCLVASLPRGSLAADALVPESGPAALVTERPAFSASAAAVPEGGVQLELGAQFDHQVEGLGLDLPLALLRYGLGGGFELRLGLPSIQLSWPANAAAATDLSPVELGAKYVYALSESVAIGALLALSLPLQAEQYDTLGVGLGGKLVWALELTDWLGLGGNFGLIFGGLGASQTDREYQVSLGFGFSLTDSLGLFVECFTLIAESAPAQAPVFVDGGLTWLVLELLQLDLYLGLDLRAAPEAVFFGLGLSHRW